VFEASFFCLESKIKGVSLDIVSLHEDSDLP
jgi:hypothetical protein